MTATVNPVAVLVGVPRTGLTAAAGFTVNSCVTVVARELAVAATSTCRVQLPVAVQIKFDPLIEQFAVLLPLSTVNVPVVPLGTENTLLVATLFAGLPLPNVADVVDHVTLGVHCAVNVKSAVFPCVHGNVTTLAPTVVDSDHPLKVNPERVLAPGSDMFAPTATGTLATAEPFSALKDAETVGAPICEGVYGRLKTRKDRIDPVKKGSPATLERPT